MVELIVLDLDKTLLNNSGEISAFSLDILRKCREADYKIVVATGRSERATMYGLNGYSPDALICNNGALGITEKKRFEKFIPSNVTENIIRYLQLEKGVQTIKVTTPQREYANQRNIMKNGVAYEYRDFQKNPLKENVYKIMFSGYNICLKVGNNFSCKCQSVRNGCSYIITSADADKANALEQITDHYRVALEEVLAFGDDVNDIDMLRLCGIGIAMENSIDKVKSVADFVCGSNDCDGVAHWLKSNLLK